VPPGERWGRSNFPPARHSPQISQKNHFRDLPTFVINGKVSSGNVIQRCKQGI